MHWFCCTLTLGVHCIGEWLFWSRHAIQCTPSVGVQQNKCMQKVLRVQQPVCRKGQAGVPQPGVFVCVIGTGTLVPAARWHFLPRQFACARVDKTPHCWLCCCSCLLSQVLMKHARPEKFMKGVFAVATAAMMLPMVLALDTSKDPSEFAGVTCL